MTLSDGYSDVPAGKIVAVVTHLEMRERAPLRPGHPPAGALIRHVARPETGWYRDLFARIGALPWLWFSRLALDEPALAAIVRDPAVEIHALAIEGRDEGLVELDFRVRGACELAFFGVAPDRIGQGAGRALMNVAIERAWSRPISRFHVHTCTLDHPAALAFYVRSGFRPVRRQVEVADDPRLTGLLPATAAAHVPILRR
jgi:hypothetical protein